MICSQPLWLAVFTNPRHEKKVAQHLQARGIEEFLPTYSLTRTWKNRQTVHLDLPLFPNYLFVRMPPQQRGTVLAVPGVVTIVGGQQRSCAIPEQYISTLRAGVASKRIFPCLGTKVGARVRIVCGPLAGIEGILACVRSDLRVVLSIELIRQSVSIEVSREEIEPIDSRLSMPGGCDPRTQC